MHEIVFIYLIRHEKYLKVSLWNKAKNIKLKDEHALS